MIECLSIEGFDLGFESFDKSGFEILFAGFDLYLKSFFEIGFDLNFKSCLK